MKTKTKNKKMHFKKIYALMCLALFSNSTVSSAITIDKNTSEIVLDDNDILTLPDIGTVDINKVIGQTKKGHAIFGHQDSKIDTTVNINTDITTSNLTVKASNFADSIVNIGKNTKYTVFKNVNDDDFNLLQVQGTNNHKAILNIDGNVQLNTAIDQSIEMVGGNNAEHNSIINLNGKLRIGGDRFFDPSTMTGGYYGRNLMIGKFSDNRGVTLNINGTLDGGQITVKGSTVNLNKNSIFNAKHLTLWGQGKFYAKGGNADIDFLSIFNEGKMEVSNNSVIKTKNREGGTIEGILDIKSDGRVETHKLTIKEHGVVLADSVGTHDYNDLYFYNNGFAHIERRGHLGLREDTDLNHLNMHISADTGAIVAIKGIGDIKTTSALDQIGNATIIASKFNFTSQEPFPHFHYHLNSNRLITMNGFSDDVANSGYDIYTDKTDLVFGLKDLFGYQKEFYVGKIGGEIKNNIVTGHGKGSLYVLNGDWVFTKPISLLNKGQLNIDGGNSTFYNLYLSDTSDINVSAGFVLLPKIAQINFEDPTTKHNDIFNINDYGTVRGDYYTLTENTTPGVTVDLNTLKLQNFINSAGTGYLILDKGRDPWTLEELKHLSQQNPDMTITILGGDPNHVDPNFPITRQGILDVSFGGQPYNYIDETQEKGTKTHFEVGSVGKQTLAIQKVILEDHDLIVGHKNGENSHLTVAGAIRRENSTSDKPIVIDHNSRLSLFNFIPKDLKNIERCPNNRCVIDLPIVGGSNHSNDENASNNILEITGNYTFNKDIGNDTSSLNLAVFKGSNVVTNDINVNRLNAEDNMTINGSLSATNVFFANGTHHINEVKEIKKGFYVTANLDTMPRIQKQDPINQTIFGVIVDNLKTNQYGDTKFFVHGAEIDNKRRAFLQVKNIEDGDKGTNTFFLNDIANLSLGRLDIEELKKVFTISIDNLSYKYGKDFDDYLYKRVFAISRLNNNKTLNLTKNHLHLGKRNVNDNLYVAKDTLFVADFSDIKKDEALIQGNGATHNFEDGSILYVYGINKNKQDKYILISDTKDASANGIQNYDKYSKKGVLLLSANRLMDLSIKQEEKDLVLTSVFNKDNNITDNINPDLVPDIINPNDNDFIDSMLDKNNGLTDEEVAESFEAASKAGAISGAYSDVIYNARKSMSLVTERLKDNTMPSLKLDIADRFYNLWSTAVYEHSNVHGYECGAYNYGLKSNLKGFVIGLDTTENNFTQGAYVSYAHIDTHNTGDFYHVNKDSNNLGLAYYLNYDFDKYSLGAIFSYNTQSNDLEHDLRFDKLNGSFDANSLNAQFNLNYRFSFDNFTLNTFALANINYLMAKDLSLYMQNEEVIKNYAENNLFTSIVVGADIGYKANFFDKELYIKHTASIDKTIGKGFFSQDMSFTGSDKVNRLSTRVLDSERYTLGTSVYYQEDTHTFKFTVSDTFSKYVNNIDIMFNYSYAF